MYFEVSIDPIIASVNESYGPCICQALLRAGIPWVIPHSRLRFSLSSEYSGKKVFAAQTLRVPGARRRVRRGGRQAPPPPLPLRGAITSTRCCRHPFQMGLGSASARPAPPRPGRTALRGAAELPMAGIFNSRSASHSLAGNNRLRPGGRRGQGRAGSL